MPTEFSTLATIAAIQHSWGPGPWDLVQIVGMMAVLIIIVSLLAVGVIGIVIAAFTANPPALKSALAEIGVTVCAGIVAVIAMTVPHPVPVPMWWVIWAGLVSAAVYFADVTFCRVGRSANPDD